MHQITSSSIVSDKESKKQNPLYNTLTEFAQTAHWNIQTNSSSAKEYFPINQNGSFSNVVFEPQSQLLGSLSFNDNRVTVEKLLAEHSRQNQLYRHELAQYFQGNAQLRQQNIFLSRKMEVYKQEKALQKEEQTEIMQSHRERLLTLQEKHDQTIMQMTKELDSLKIDLQSEKIKNRQLQHLNQPKNTEIYLIEELSRLQAENEYVHGLARQCKKEYDVLMESYKFFQKSFQKNHKNVKNIVKTLESKPDVNIRMENKETSSSSLVKLNENEKITLLQLQIDRLNEQTAKRGPNKETPPPRLERSSEPTKLAEWQSSSIKSSTNNNKVAKLTLQTEDQKISKNIIQLSAKVKEYEHKTKEWSQQKTSIMEEVNRLRDENEKQHEYIRNHSKEEKQKIQKLEQIIEEKDSLLLDLRNEIKSKYRTINLLESKNLQISMRQVKQVISKSQVENESSIKEEIQSQSSQSDSQRPLLIPPSWKKIVDTLKDENIQLIQQNKDLKAQIANTSTQNVEHDSKMTEVINEVQQKLKLLETQNKSLKIKLSEGQNQDKEKERILKEVSSLQKQINQLQDIVTAMSRSPQPQNLKKFLPMMNNINRVAFERQIIKTTSYFSKLLTLMEQAQKNFSNIKMILTVISVDNKGKLNYGNL